MHTTGCTSAMKGETPLRSYHFYTTCPKCAQAYGVNYVVGFEQVAETAP